MNITCFQVTGSSLLPCGQGNHCYCSRLRN